jgi:hypothetical protein
LTAAESRVRGLTKKGAFCDHFSRRFLIGYSRKSARSANRFGTGADVNVLFTNDGFPQKSVERLLIAP